MKTKLLIILLLLFTIGLHAQQTEKRLALVIGNAAYPKSSLNNPVNDANLMEETLNQLGFTVLKITNATKYKMQQAIDNFKMQLPNYNVALFYYAGHGMEINGRNYIIPIDAKNSNENIVRIGSIDIGHVIQEFENYTNNVNIVILDACRDNPFVTNSRGGNRGFTTIPAPSGTIIAYATAPGKTASDGNGKNGLYTEILATEMLKPNRLLDVFMYTRNRVNKRNSNQNPQEWTQLKAPFYFVGSIKNIDNIKPVIENKPIKNNIVNEFVDDRDGKAYRIVKIGGQVWMAQNLAYSPKTGNYWSYDNNSSNVGNYGYLYDYKTAKKVCPYGWRLPTKEDYSSLFKNYANAYYSLVSEGSLYNAKLAGCRTADGKYDELGYRGFWWMYNDGYLTTSNGKFIFPSNGVPQLSSFYKKWGYSVRCIKVK